MNIITRTVKGLTILAWLLVSLYFGISGYLTVDLLNLIEKAVFNSNPYLTNRNEFKMAMLDQNVNLIAIV